MPWAGALLSGATLPVMYKLLTLGAPQQLLELRLVIQYVTLKVTERKKNAIITSKEFENSTYLLIITPIYLTSFH